MGPGFTIDIFTTCSCIGSTSQDDLIYGGVDPSVAADFEAQVLALDANIGMVSSLSRVGDDQLKIVHALTGLKNCGGVNVSTPPLTICTTMMDNHFTASVLMEVHLTLVNS